MENNAATAVIEDGNIVIRLPFSHIPHGVKAGCDLGYIHGDWRVTNPEVFAKEMVRALNDEDEQGTTPIHRLLDEATNEAIESGAEGIEEFVCPKCDNGGWVMNSQQPPPQFDECRECHNPLGLPCP